MFSAEQIEVKSAFEKLCNNHNSILVDVRTNEEFASVGVVDDKNFCNKSILLPFFNINQISGEMVFNADFISTLEEKAISSNKNKSDIELFFICRSGARSNKAAEVALQFGFKNVFNIVSGFEGDADEKGQRSKLNGWIASDLPWRKL